MLLNTKRETRQVHPSSYYHRERREHHHSRSCHKKLYISSIARRV